MLDTRVPTCDETKFCELWRDYSPGGTDTDLYGQVNVGSDGNLQVPRGREVTVNRDGRRRSVKKDRLIVEGDSDWVSGEGMVEFRYVWSKWSSKLIQDKPDFELTVLYQSLPTGRSRGTRAARRSDGK